jgi:hypothetical protein
MAELLVAAGYVGYADELMLENALSVPHNTHPPLQTSRALIRA